MLTTIVVFLFMLYISALIFKQCPKVNDTILEAHEKVVDSVKKKIDKYNNKKNSCDTDSTKETK